MCGKRVVIFFKVWQACVWQFFSKCGKRVWQLPDSRCGTIPLFPAALMAEQDTEYEKKRRHNIETNNAFLASLGLEDAAVLLPKSKPPQQKKEKKKTSQQKPQQEPRRTSRHQNNGTVYLDALSDDYESDEDKKGKRKRKMATRNASRASARKMQAVSYAESEEDEDEDDDNDINLWKQELPCTEEALTSDWNLNEQKEFVIDDETWKKIERYRTVKYVF